MADLIMSLVEQYMERREITGDLFCVCVLPLDIVHDALSNLNHLYCYLSMCVKIV